MYFFLCWRKLSANDAARKNERPLKSYLLITGRALIRFSCRILFPLSLASVPAMGHQVFPFFSTCSILVCFCSSSVSYQPVGASRVDRHLLNCRDEQNGAVCEGYFWVMIFFLCFATDRCKECRDRMNTALTLILVLLSGSRVWSTTAP